MDFFNHLKTYLSDEQIEKLAQALDKPSKHALLLNEEKMSKETLLSIYPSLVNHPIIPNAFIYDKDELDLGKSVYHELGCFYLQEPSAMLPAYLLNPNENDLVLDLCAAPGGKSMQASFLMHNKGLIISNDLAKNRAFAISENAERLGRGNLLIVNDFSTIEQYYLNTFDKIILDAPCSGSGMFRKQNEMKEDWSIAKVNKFAEIQKSLILMCYNMLKEGGEMVYSTCSFSYEEDEEVIKYLLDNTDAEINKIDDNPIYYVDKKLPYGVHLLPSLFPGEGHYICLIKKPGILKKNNVKESNDKFPYKIETNGYQYYQKFGDYLYIQDKEINLKHLNIIRYGVKVGQIDKGDIRFDYHYAHFVNSFNNIYELNDEEIAKYYLGEAINKSALKGYILLKYQGINVDIAKSDGRIIKNRLPKGLRKKLIAR